MKNLRLSNFTKLSIIFGSLIILLTVLSGCMSTTNASNAVVKNGTTVCVDYIGKFENGTVFDTSIKSVAIKNGIYNPNREYKPLNFTVGKGQLIKGFENAVIGMHVGENKTVTIPPEEAYGVRNDKLIIPLPIEAFKNANITPIVGKYIYVKGTPAKIIKVNDTNVVLDFNPPLAGKSLIFTIKVISIEK
ncbi:peptidylprolyl isomerase [Methanothermococcus sp.]|uniref:FKBP-type peptidyl-prolyl cis-trans isomerase n=1 Tax=Methanothermococcus sp. TaxID=2614238 RepID=UPI00345C207F